MLIEPAVLRLLCYFSCISVTCINCIQCWGSIYLEICVPVIWSHGVSILANGPSHGRVSSKVGWLLVSRGFKRTASTFFHPLASADLAPGVARVKEGVWSSSLQDSGSSTYASGTPVGIYKSRNWVIIITIISYFKKCKKRRGHSSTEDYCEDGDERSCC